VLNVQHGTNVLLARLAGIAAAVVVVNRERIFKRRRAA
jgi:hypothetical protein